MERYTGGGRAYFVGKGVFSWYHLVQLDLNCLPLDLNIDSLHCLSFINDTFAFENLVGNYTISPSVNLLMLSSFWYKM